MNRRSFLGILSGALAAINAPLPAAITQPEVIEVPVVPISKPTEPKESIYSINEIQEFIRKDVIRMQAKIAQHYKSQRTTDYSPRIRIDQNQ